MDPMLLGGLIGAGTGLAKWGLVDRPREERQRKLAAETARLSPWTGLKPSAVQESDLLGNLMQGGSTGAGMGQNYQRMGSDQKLNDAMTSYYGSRQAPVIPAPPVEAPMGPANPRLQAPAAEGTSLQLDPSEELSQPFQYGPRPKPGSVKPYHGFGRR
jgi:hypothetical protein